MRTTLVADRTASNQDNSSRILRLVKARTRNAANNRGNHSKVNHNKANHNRVNHNHSRGVRKAGNRKRGNRKVAGNKPEVNGDRMVWKTAASSRQSSANACAKQRTCAAIGVSVDQWAGLAMLLNS